MNRKQTNARRKAIYLDRAAGKPWNTIAEKHGFHSASSAVGAARTYAKDKSLPWPPLDREVVPPFDPANPGLFKDKVEERFPGFAEAMQEKSVRLVAKQYEISTRSVSRMRDYLGIAARPSGGYHGDGPRCGMDLGLAYQLFADGESANKIAARWNVSGGIFRNWVPRWAVEHGLPWPPREVHNTKPRSEDGALAYELKLGGHTWKQIADRVGYNTDVRALAAAKKHALFHDLPWPLEKKHSGSHSTRPIKAYKMRVRGEKWADIAEKLEYSSPASAQTCAREFAHLSKKPWPIAIPKDKRPSLVYEARLGGQTWVQIAQQLGMTDREHAHATARRYAKANGLKWPLPRATTRQDPKSFYTSLGRQATAERRKKAYGLRQEGSSWQEIAQQLEYSCSTTASKAADEHSEDCNLPPPDTDDVIRIRKAEVGRRLRGNGFCLKHAAEQSGYCSAQALRSALSYHKEETGKPKLTPRRGLCPVCKKA